MEIKGSTQHLSRDKVNIFNGGISDFYSLCFRVYYLKTEKITNYFCSFLFVLKEIPDFNKDNLLKTECRALKDIKFHVEFF